MPIVLMPIYGLPGAAIGFFLSYVCYTVIMMVLAFRRSGRWLGSKTLAWFLAAAFILGLAEWAAVCVGGLYGGLIPSLVVTASCAWVYFHAMRQAEKPATG